MLIRVKVKTGARKESVIKKSEDRLEVSVRARAERGEANAQVLLLVAEYFGVSASKVRMVRGRTTPNKTLQVFN